MPNIVLSKGESMLKLMIKAGLVIDTLNGLWFLKKGSLQKIANKDNSNDYAIINIYSQGDYLMGDSDLNIDYIAMEDSVILEVSLNEIDPIQLMFQLDAVEELMFVNSFKFEEDSLSDICIKTGRFYRFLSWLSKRLGRHKVSIPEILNQTDMGKLVGATRVTVNRKIQVIKKLTELNGEINNSVYK